ncbi:choice-of-anchor P family protein [Spirillospora sp. CA-253888]
MSCRKAARRLVQVSVIVMAAGVLAAAPAAAETGGDDSAARATASVARSGGPGASAFGLGATGPVRVPQVPAVSSSAGEVAKSLVREDRTKLVKAAALDVRAQHDRARSQVADLRVPSAGLRAEAVTARCLAGRGAASLADAVVAGRPLAVAPPPNTTIPVDLPELGRASVVMNKQQRLPDGRLNVTALEVNLPLGQGRTESIRVASATCGRAAGRPEGPKGPQGPHEPKGPKGPRGPQKPAQQHAEAPVPTPVKGDLAVTG